MSAELALQAGRAAARALMIDTCLITRPDVTYTSPETGIVAQSTVTLYQGMCRIQVAPESGQANQSDVGERHIFHQRLALQLPIEATLVVGGDLVAILTCALDTRLPGKTYRVRAISGKTHATKRIVELDEVSPA